MARINDANTSGRSIM